MSGKKGWWDSSELDAASAEAFERTHERRRRVYGTEDPRKLKGANTDDDDEPSFVVKGFILVLFILFLIATWGFPRGSDWYFFF